MECGYRGWIIDAAPDFLFGKFFAHARLVRTSTDDDTDGEMHIERHIACFDTEEEAIEFAQQWAFEWISRHEGEVISKSNEPPAPRVDTSIEVTAR